MDLSSIKKLYETYIAGTYTRQDIFAEHGESAVVTGGEGLRYIDFSSGIGVNSLGFAAPAWARAVKDQVDAICHISNLYYTVPQALLAEALCKRTGMKKVFFANSGAEANEGAIKTARRYGESKSRECFEIISLQNSFHGRTIATLAATGQNVFHEHFGPFPRGFVHAQANDTADLRAKVNRNTCAILIECIQGEGGVNMLDAGYLETIASICEENDILLIADEIQTGVGRTGKFLCCEHFGIKPDIVTLAKGLGGGLPIGAVLFGEKVQDTLGPGDHGSTFGGNPVVCAGANAVLETLDEAFLSGVVQKGEYLREQLLSTPGVRSVSGMGMMLGVELDEGLSAADVVRECGKRGLLLLTAKHKLRLLPPLNIPAPEIDAGLLILRQVLTKCKEEAN